MNKAFKIFISFIAGMVLAVIPVLIMICTGNFVYNKPPQKVFNIDTTNSIQVQGDKIIVEQLHGDILTDSSVKNVY